MIRLDWALHFNKPTRKLPVNQEYESGINNLLEDRPLLVSGDGNV